MAGQRSVHRCKGETMSHQGGNTLRTALIAVAAAAVFILGCGLFTLHVRARSAAHIAWAEMQCSTSGQHYDNDRNRPLHNPTTRLPAHVVQRDSVPEGQILDHQDTPVPASSCTYHYRYPLLQRCLLQGLHVHPVLVVCIHNDRCYTHTYTHAPNCCCCTWQWQFL